MYGSEWFPPQMKRVERITCGLVSSLGDGLFRTLNVDRLGYMSQACNMSQACRDGLLARQRHRFKELCKTGGEPALQELTCRKPLLADRTAPEIEALILDPSVHQGHSLQIPQNERNPGR